MRVVSAVAASHGAHLELRADTATGQSNGRGQSAQEVGISRARWDMQAGKGRESTRRGPMMRRGMSSVTEWRAVQQRPASIAQGFTPVAPATDALVSISSGRTAFRRLAPPCQLANSRCQSTLLPRGVTMATVEAAEPRQPGRLIGIVAESFSSRYLATEATWGAVGTAAALGSAAPWAQ